MPIPQKQKKGKVKFSKHNVEKESKLCVIDSRFFAARHNI
jgi:hypothetical protein